jgi:hypothetical protein
LGLPQVGQAESDGSATAAEGRLSSDLGSLR